MRKVIVGVLLMLVVGVRVEAGKVATVTVVGVPSAAKVPAYWWKYVEWHQEVRSVGRGWDE